MNISYLNGLRALESTLRNGTFSAAAEELGVTVAAVGQHVRTLEEYFGVRLFDRRPDGVRATAEARAVANRLTLGFTHLEDAFAELARARRGGRLRITLSHFVLDDWLAQRMPRFHAAHPDIEVLYETSETFVDLLKNEVDFAIRFSPEPGPAFKFEALYQGCFMPVCTPEFAARYNLHPGCRDLTGVPLFKMHDATVDPAWVDWNVLLQRHDILRGDPGPVQQIAGYRVALAGSGLVLTGLTESFNDLADGRVVAPLGPKLVTPFTFGYRLVWPAGRSLTPAMRNFRNWLLEERDTFLGEASSLLGVKLS